MYTIVGSTKNRTLRVIWTLQELGVAYDQIDAKPGTDDAKAHVSTGKVPALIVGDRTLTDSVAIMTFLTDAHQGLTHPAGSVARLEQDGHMNFLIEEFDSLLWHAAKHSFIYPPERRVAHVKPQLMWEFERSLARLDDRLQGDFLMGDKMTIADIMAVHCLNWSIVAKFPRPSDKLLAYSKRLRSRPAYVRTLESA